MTKNQKKFLWFDLDGTLVNLYKDENWLERIEKEDVTLYSDADPLVDLKDFKELIKNLKEKGIGIGVISYLPWNGSKKYNLEVKKAKEVYLKEVFSDIEFDKIHITSHTKPKESFASKGDVLIDDDKKNRCNWDKGKSYTEKNLINKLKRIYNI